MYLKWINVAQFFFVKRAQEIFKEALQAPVMNLRIAISDDAPPLPSHSLIFKPNACRKPLPELPLDSDVPNTSTPSKELGEDEPTPVKSHENRPFLKESPVTPVKRAPSTVTKQAPSTITKQAPSTITKQTPSACQRQMTQSDLKVLTGSKQTHYSCTNLAPSSEVKCSQSSAVKQHMTPSLTGKGGPSQNPYSSTHKGTFTPLHTTKAVRKKVHVQLVKGIYYSIVYLYVLLFLSLSEYLLIAFQIKAINDHMKVKRRTLPFCISFFYSIEYC